jgi:multiple sugar transport system permease protein
MKAKLEDRAVYPAGGIRSATLGVAARQRIPWYQRHAVRQTVGQVVAYAALIAGSTVMVLPFFRLISTSLTVRGLEFQVPPQWIPRPIAWRNYYEALFESGLPFPRFFVNTVSITVLSMVGTLFSGSLAGFGFARLRFPGRDPLFVLVLSTMMLPSIVTLIPTYLLFKTIGWVDTWLPLIVPSYLGGGAFYVFLFRQFFLGLPLDLDEAARIDGASTWQIYLHVALPLSRPVLITVAIFTFLGNWNNFLDALIYLNSPPRR